MAWYVITSYPGQERKIRNAVKEENPNYSQPFDCYILPVRNVLLHEDTSHESRRIGMVFLKTDNADDIPDLLSVLSIKYNLHCHLMYDRINRHSLVVPETQMKLFMEVHPEEIEELLLLSKPFKDYAAKNERYVIVGGPLEGLEGYKINLHKDKKLAVELGGMTLAINNIYSYKIARVFEPEKDKIFAHQQKDRIICHLIGCLQVNGFPDNAYEVLRYIIEQTHAHNDDLVAFEQSFAKENVHVSIGVSDAIEISSISSFLSRLDATTAGYIQSLAEYFYREFLHPDLVDFIPERRILPFLTPTSGSLDNPQPRELTIEHMGFTEHVRLVNFTELRLQGNKSKEVKTPYYAHIGINKSSCSNCGRQSSVSIFSTFDTLLESLSLSPSSDPDIYISNGVKALETLIQSPRNAALRQMLPQVLIHQA